MRARLRFEVLQDCGFRCFYCGCRAEDAPLHVDHHYPKALGGTDDRWNLVAACRCCNLGKGAEPIRPSRLRQGQLWCAFVWEWVGAFGRAELHALPDMERLMPLLEDDDKNGDVYDMLQALSDAGAGVLDGRTLVAFFWRYMRERASGLQ